MDYESIVLPNSLKNFQSYDVMKDSIELSKTQYFVNGYIFFQFSSLTLLFFTLTSMFKFFFMFLTIQTRIVKVKTRPRKPATVIIEGSLRS